MRIRSVVPSIALRLSAVAGNLRAAVFEGFKPMAKAYFETHLLSCHDSDPEKGDFLINMLSSKVSTEDTPQRLDVMSRITSGEMHPLKAKKRLSLCLARACLPPPVEEAPARQRPSGFGSAR